MRRVSYVEPNCGGRYETILRWNHVVGAFQIVDYVGGQSVGDVILTRDCLVDWFGEDAVAAVERRMTKEGDK